MYFHYSVFLSSWITNWLFIWRKLYHLHWWMLWAKLNWNWSSGSGEENNFKCDKFTTKTKPENFFLHEYSTHSFCICQDIFWFEKKCMHYNTNVPWKRGVTAITWPGNRLLLLMNMDKGNTQTNPPSPIVVRDPQDDRRRAGFNQTEAYVSRNGIYVLFYTTTNQEQRKVNCTENKQY